MGTYENERQTYVLRTHLWKTCGKHMFCIGNNGKRKANLGFAWEPIENARQTQVLCGNLLWETQRKHRSCVGTYGKRKENVGFASEPIENTLKT